MQTILMTSKSLKKMEVLKGFIQIPVAAERELIGDISLPFGTKLNGNSARLDRHRRLWSPYLRNRFSIGTEIIIKRIGSEYKIESKTVESEAPAIKPVESPSDRCVNETRSDLSAQCRVIAGDCLTHLNAEVVGNVHLTFFDPPYNQGKSYRFFDDDQTEAQYWKWIMDVLERVYDLTEDGGAVYFMQREKNAEEVLESLRITGWTFQNLIIWKKKTSAVPCMTRFSKQYQIIAYAIKGKRPRVFNKLRTDPPPLPEHKYVHDDGVYVTDVWDDIRELTSGYFAGDEAIRDDNGQRVHTQQSPISLLMRIILSSTLPKDVVLDPVAGTGTTLVVAKQLARNSVGIEIDPAYATLIEERLGYLRPADCITRYLDYYRFTPDLRRILGLEGSIGQTKVFDSLATSSIIKPKETKRGSLSKRNTLKEARSGVSR